jgi:hypothetical protein
VREAGLYRLGEGGRRGEEPHDEHNHVLEITPTGSEDLREAWEAAARGGLEALERGRKWPRQEVPEQYLVLVTCRDEQHQGELIGRFQREGLVCKALLS